jgi:hypothetical protein
MDNHGNGKGINMIKFDLEDIAEDLEAITQFLELNAELREYAIQFIDFEIRTKDLKSKIFGEEYEYKTPTPESDSNVVIDVDEIIYRYEINTACHCHPVYEKTDMRFPIKDLLAYITKNNL